MNRLIVIGASSGGVAALLQLAAELPANLPAAVLVVLHIGAHRSVMPELLAAKCALDVAAAHDGEELRAGRLRIAPSDLHLLVDGSRCKLLRGPKEHHSRPAIDPLFRSAALACGAKVIGVVLTGDLDDGTSGLQSIKAAGGMAVVQDPATAFAPSMPTSALRHVAVDHCVGIDAMAALLIRLSASSEPAAATGDLEAARREVELSMRRGDPIEHLAAIGTPSPFTCPECHGGLWELRNSNPIRFRCHTGHGFSIRSLQDAMAQAADESGWNALRAIQERETMIRQMLVRVAASDELPSDRLRAAAAALEEQARLLRKLLESGPEPIE